MKKSFALIGLILMACAAFVVSCDDDEPTKVPEESQLINDYQGLTVGSSQHFQGLIDPERQTDIVTVAASTVNSSNFDIVYDSPYWGKATFKNVKATKFANAWTFSDAEGVISMPRRTPGVTEVTYNEYPATLNNSQVVLSTGKGDVTTATFTVNANLGERAGIYTLLFTSPKPELK